MLLLLLPMRLVTAAGRCHSFSSGVLVLFLTVPLLTTPPPPHTHTHSCVEPTCWQKILNASTTGTPKGGKLKCCARLNSFLQQQQQQQCRQRHRRRKPCWLKDHQHKRKWAADVCTEHHHTNIPLSTHPRGLCTLLSAPPNIAFIQRSCQLTFTTPFLTTFAQPVAARIRFLK